MSYCNMYICILLCKSKYEYICLYHDLAAFPLIYTRRVKGGAYHLLEYLMNKLKSDCFIGYVTSI